MKKILLFATTVLLISCASHMYGNLRFRVESEKVDYYDEWGLFKFTGQNVLSNASGDVSAEDVSPEKLCKEFIGFSDAYAAQLYSDSSTGNITLECLTLINPTRSSFTERVFLGMMIGTFSVERSKDDSLYYVLYGGNKMLLQSEEILHHRLICQEKKIDFCPLDERFEQQRDNIYFRGPFYGLTIPVNRSFYSITKFTDPKDLEGYKPLKLDPSILPLESPGYKKLREQEEALGRK